MSSDVLDAPAAAGRPVARSASDDILDALASKLAVLPAGHRYYIDGVSWDGYGRLLEQRDLFRRGARIAFNAGALELMTVTNPHERWKTMLARLLETLCLALRIPISGSGNVTLRREDLDGGFEPDACYYIQHAAAMRTIRLLDLTADPPPDLAIEIELGRTLVDRLDLCHSLGIPELWRFNGTALTFWGLTADGYEALDVSRAFPSLPSAVVQTFLLRTGTLDDTSLCWEFFDWVRANLSAPTT